MTQITYESIVFLTFETSFSAVLVLVINQERFVIVELKELIFFWEDGKDDVFCNTKYRCSQKIELRERKKFGSNFLY